MRCPHCHKSIMIKEKKEDGCYTSGTTRLVMSNFMILGIPLGMLTNWLDNTFSLGWSMETGASWNIYLMPMLVVALFYMIYTLLYSFGKVKGSFFIIKPDKKIK